MPFDMTNLTACWVTFSQNCTEVFSLCKNDVEVNGDVISCTLTQAQTLSLTEKCPAHIQIRASVGGKVVASEIMTVTVGKILKDGEI
jgi:hypothetical protein